jgi:hypothetical protein
MTQCEAHLGDLSSSRLRHQAQHFTASSNSACHRFIQLDPPPLHPTRPATASSNSARHRFTKRNARPLGRLIAFEPTLDDSRASASPAPEFARFLLKIPSDFAVEARSRLISILTISPGGHPKNPYDSARDRDAEIIEDF